MRWITLLLVFSKFTAWGQTSFYSSELKDLSQEVLCDAEDFEKTKLLLEKVRAKVNQDFEDRAKADNLSLYDYLNKKETSSEFLALLRTKNSMTYINSLSHAEFMLESLELGLKYQALSTVRFPSLDLIDEGGQILQDKWMTKIMEISENPQGCQNSPQIHSDDRESGKDVEQGTSSSPENVSSGASAR